MVSPSQEVNGRSTLNREASHTHLNGPLSPGEVVVDEGEVAADGVVHAQDPVHHVSS